MVFQMTIIAYSFGGILLRLFHFSLIFYVFLVFTSKWLYDTNRKMILTIQFLLKLYYFNSLLCKLECISLN